MQESFPLEHGSELVADTLEELLDSGRVTQEGNRHLQTTRRNVALSGQHVVGNPLDEVGRVLVLDVLHLLLDVLHGDLATEDGGDGQVTTVTGIGSGHHVLGIEHLLGKLSDSDSTVLVAATSGQGGKTGHEEVETRERN